jgi:EAL domain-containing protein (putative c-di-GMP-specific phosphodiesterase class I)
MNYYSVELMKDPGRGKLSKSEIEKLTDITERFHTMDDWELSEHTHTFSEWQKRHTPGASTPIPWREMLEAQAKAELCEIVEWNEAARQYLNSLFRT